MAAGGVFPPIVVFFDGAEYWLGDGFHRIIAAVALGLVEIAADVREDPRRHSGPSAGCVNARKPGTSTRVQ
jgi:ParB-like chromosome segregation protein Spo0J